MSDFIMEQVFQIVQMNTARRISALNQLRELAVARGLVALVAHIDRALVQAHETLSQERIWRYGRSRRNYAAKVPGLDNEVDGLLVGFRDVAEGHARGLAADDPLPRRIDHMLNDAFPGGVGALVSLPYVEQVAETEQALARLQQEHLPLVQELGLAPRLQRLSAKVAEYRAAIDQSAGVPDFARVRAAQQRGHRYLLEVVSLVLAASYDSDDPAHLALRATLMAPILEQDRQVRALWRARRAGQSAADGTGEEGFEGEDELLEDELPDEILDEELPGELPGEMPVSAAS